MRPSLEGIMVVQADKHEPLLYHSAIARFYELDQRIHIFAAIRFGLELLQGLRGIQLRCQQNLIRVVDLANAAFGEAATLQTDRVQTISVRAALCSRF